MPSIPAPDDGPLHPGELEAQRRFGVIDQAAAMSAIIRDRLTASMVAFMERQLFFFMATANHRGECDCSYRGRQHTPPHPPEPLLRVLDPVTLVFPDYPGNNLYNSLGNIVVNSNIGMLFMDFAAPRRLRVNGHAEIVENHPPHDSLWPTAPCLVRVTVRQAFPNCKDRIPTLSPPRA